MRFCGINRKLHGAVRNHGRVQVIELDFLVFRKMDLKSFLEDIRGYWAAPGVPLRIDLRRLQGSLDGSWCSRFTNFRYFLNVLEI